MPVAGSRLLAEFVLFAGLGDFDDFGAEAPAFVAENIVRTLARTRVEDFATVLFGAGSGVPVAMALEQQLRGFVAGVQHADPDAVIRRISICEIDARKYTALVRAARELAPGLNAAGLTLLVDEVPADDAARRPPGRSPRRARSASAQDPVYLLVSMTPVERGEVECRSSVLTAGAKAAVLSGTLKLRRAALLQQFESLESGAATSRDLARIGSALAQTLLPATVREGLAAMPSRPLVIVHDVESSRVPWEVLRIGTVHPALAGGLSRRYASDALSVARWRDDRKSGDPLRVLLIVDPTRDLPGAAAEGAAIKQLLVRRGVTFDVLAGRDATRARIVAALGTGAFDVLHFAGHAFFDAGEPRNGGLVCDGKEVLRAEHLASVGSCRRSFSAMRAKRLASASRPGRRPAAARLRGSHRTMTGIAEAFLAGGVANFVGTHWPVGTKPPLPSPPRCTKPCCGASASAMPCLPAGNSCTQYLVSTGPTTSTTAARSSGSPEFREPAHVSARGRPSAKRVSRAGTCGPAHLFASILNAVAQNGSRITFRRRADRKNPPSHDNPSWKQQTRMNNE